MTKRRKRTRSDCIRQIKTAVSQSETSVDRERQFYIAVLALLFSDMRISSEIKEPVKTNTEPRASEGLKISSGSPRILFKNLKSDHF